MSTVFMFAGQGSQYVGMGKELYDQYPSARAIFERANTLLGYSLTDIMFADEEKLNDTLYTQVAMFTLYAATLEVLRESGVTSEYTCGLSLGEYGALYDAGVFDFETGLLLLEKRGEFMNQACATVDGKMSAIIGLDTDVLEAIIAQETGYVKIANYNTYGQLVISGEEDAVLRVNEEALKQGAKRAILLNTSGPFHTKLMEEASVKLGKYVLNLELGEPNKKLLLNTTGTVYNMENLKEVMPTQITSSVLFYQMIEQLLDNGVDTFIEIGPKKTLGGFVKKINRNVNILNVEDMSSLQNTIEKTRG